MPLDAIEVETRDGLQRVPLDKPRLTIGRLPGNDIVLPFTQISRHHAELRQQGNDWWIRDLGSTNGLRVGNHTVKDYLLRYGDSVILAPSIILHYIGQRPDVTVEGTVRLPGVMPGRPLALPTRAPDPMPSAARTDPFGVSAAEIAAAASMQLPRRKLGVTPPPSAQAALGPSPGPGDDLDAWLNSLAAPEPPHAPPIHLPGELPIGSPFALLRDQAAAAPRPVARKPILYLCPTCGERTAPDSPYCWSCRQTIAQPCQQCGIYLLPIQASCPRCQTPNHNAVRR